MSVHSETAGDSFRGRPTPPETEILDEIRALAARALGAEAGRPVDADFPVRDLDSMSRTAVLVEIEDHFRVALPDERLADIATLGELARVVRESLAEVDA